MYVLMGQRGGERPSVHASSPFSLVGLPPIRVLAVTHNKQAQRTHLFVSSQNSCFRGHYFSFFYRGKLFASGLFSNNTNARRDSLSAWLGSTEG